MNVYSHVGAMPTVNGSLSREIPEIKTRTESEPAEYSLGYNLWKHCLEAGNEKLNNVERQYRVMGGL